MGSRDQDLSIRGLVSRKNGMAQKTGAFCKKTLEGSRDNRVEAGG
jgi:hypothetical protein